MDFSAFLEFSRTHKASVDFISTHHYPTDAFGKVGADTLTQLRHASPNVMRDDAKKVQAQARGLPVYYTEWNISSNPRDSLHDQPFTAAYATRIILENRDLVEGYSFWTFSDIFNEDYFPSVPFHGGFSLMNLHEIPETRSTGRSSCCTIWELRLSMSTDNTQPLTPGCFSNRAPRRWF